MTGSQAIVHCVLSLIRVYWVAVLVTVNSCLMMQHLLQSRRLEED